MNIFVNRKQALEGEYVVLVPPSRPLDPVRLLAGVLEAELKELKVKHPNLVSFKKDNV
jgi:hypothetical protein